MHSTFVTPGSVVFSFEEIHIQIHFSLVSIINMLSKWALHFLEGTCYFSVFQSTLFPCPSMSHVSHLNPLALFVAPASCAAAWCDTESGTKVGRRLR